MTRLEQNYRNISDPRTQVTYVIWGCAVGMFALCIPLAALNRGALIISAAVALGAGTGTVAVWKSDPHSKRRMADEQTMRSLEERITNLEAIASHSELDMHHQFKQLELKDHQT